MAEADSDEWWQPISSSKKTIAFFIGHGIAMIAFGAVVKGVEVAIEFINHGHEPMLYDRIPFHYLTNGADIGLFVFFVAKGLYHFLRL